MRKPRDEHFASRLIAVGERVRSQRLRLGLSQEELAGRAHLHRTYIGSVERGQRNLSLSNLFALAEALRLRIEELLVDASSD